MNSLKTTMANQHKYKARILHWNARSIAANKSNLLNYLKTETIDFMLISETWLKPHHTFKISSYSCIRKDRGPDGKGGVAILVSNKYNYQTLTTKCSRSGRGPN
jgi:exonuclease III